MGQDVAQAVEKMIVKDTGGSTGCNHTNCSCRIKNEDYEDFKSTNKKCTICKHPYYDHDIFAWGMKQIKLNIYFSIKLLYRNNKI